VSYFVAPPNQITGHTKKIRKSIDLLLLSSVITELILYASIVLIIYSILFQVSFKEVVLFNPYLVSAVCILNILRSYEVFFIMALSMSVSSDRINCNIIIIKLNIYFSPKIHSTKTYTDIS
jgi:hypothetical protein